MNRYTVAYHAATYSGEMHVWADTEEQAIAMVRKRVQKEMILRMYSDSYRVVKVVSGEGQ